MREIGKNRERGKIEEDREEGRERKYVSIEY